MKQEIINQRETEIAKLYARLAELPCEGYEAQRAAVITEIVSLQDSAAKLETSEETKKASKRKLWADIGIAAASLGVNTFVAVIAYGIERDGSLCWKTFSETFKDLFKIKRL